MNFTFLVNGSKEIGMGHLNRCLILAEALEKLNHKVFYITNEDKEGEYFLKNKRFRIEYINELIATDICIIDLYNYQDSFYAGLRRKYKILIIFDDCEFRIPYGVDAVINTNIYARADFYNEDKKLFLGPKYILLRKEFLTPIKRRKKDRILVCMGGSDPEKQSFRVVKLIRSFTEIPIDIIFGIEEEANEFLKSVNYKDIYVYINVKEMKEFMNRALICICGSGSMIYELVYMNVPFVCLILARNQELIGREVSRRKWGECLGYFSMIDDEEMGKKLKDIIEKTTLNKIQEKDRETLIDGKGARRLAIDLTRWVKERFYEQKGLYRGRDSEGI